MSQKKHTAALRAQTRLTPEEDPEFQIAPMVDILLVLLVFFMTISSTEAIQTNQNVQLPVSKDAKAPGDNPSQVIINVLWVEMTNMGSIELDESIYRNPNEITTVLTRRLQQRADLRVLLRADRGVRYEYLKDILRAIGDSGVSNVTFSVVDKSS